MSGPEPQDATTTDLAGEFSPNFCRTILETANEGIWIIDLDARTIFANERMARMLGTLPDDLIGRSPFEFLDEEDQVRGAEVMAQNFEGHPVEFEIRFRRGDGSYIPMLGGTAPLRDEHGKITGSVATFSDVTAQKAAEQALRDSERQANTSAELLTQLLESATDAIWMRDPQGVFRVANPAACAVMGGTADKVIGRSVHEIWGPHVGAHLVREAEGLFTGRRGITVEEEMFDAGKKRMTIFLSNKVPLYSPDGQPVGILGVSRDITDRKRDENELREGRARLAQQFAELNALYQAAPIGLGFFDRDYRYLRINEQLAQINGVPAADHLGKTLRDIIPVNAGSVEPIVDRIFASGEAIGDVEISGETPQQPGVLRHWLCGFYPVHGEGGEVEAVGAWVIEISERKAAEQRETLLAREVDHRAKNLLAVVQSVVQLTHATDPDELKAGIVGRIQSLARAHSLLAEARWDGAQLGDLVREELAPYLDGSEARVTAEGPPVLLRPAAAQSLAMVLHELATNAVKYGALSTAAGRLELTWTLSREWIELNWVERDGPAVTAPETSGFGSKIMRASVERQFHGSLVQDWHRDGLRCTIRISAREATAAVS